MGGSIVLVPIVIIVIIIAVLLIRSRYKIAKSNEALVITGGKKRQAPEVLVAGGKFISPFEKHEYFKLDVMTVVSDNKETQTKTFVPVVVTWTAQLRPDFENNDSLEKAVMGFIGKRQEEIENSLQQTLEGEVRAVVATLTPEEVIEGRDKFKTDVENNVKERMVELGFKLISLNITQVSDNQNHYDNLAAKNREETRRAAKVLTAQEEQLSETAAIEKEKVVAEKGRDLSLAQSSYKRETDIAATNAEYAGKIRKQESEKDLAISEGDVAVERETQNKRAAEARRNVVTTEAETAKQKLRIDAEAAAQKSEIDAKIGVVIAEQAAEARAKAAERDASGQAEAEKRRAEGKAQARKTEADAEAEYIKKTRLANADGIAAEGRAEAEAIRQKGLASAEAERAKAEALAANDRVNLEVTLAEIQRDTTVKVMSSWGEIMAHVGENATFIDMGGGSHGEGGDLLSRVLGDIPELLKKLEVKNSALNGESFLTSLNGLTSAIINKEPVYNAKSVETGEASAPAPATAGAAGTEEAEAENIIDIEPYEVSDVQDIQTVEPEAPVTLAEQAPGGEASPIPQAEAPAAAVGAADAAVEAEPDTAEEDIVKEDVAEANVANEDAAKAAHEGAGPEAEEAADVDLTTDMVSNILEDPKVANEVIGSILHDDEVSDDVVSSITDTLSELWDAEEVSDSDLVHITEPIAKAVAELHAKGEVKPKDVAKVAAELLFDVDFKSEKPDVIARKIAEKTLAAAKKKRK